MSDLIPSGDPPKSAAWAPYDYTDGKKRGEWQTSYPTEARKMIRRETAFLVIIFIVCIVGVFSVLWQACRSSEGVADPAQKIDQGSVMFFGYLGAIFAGTLGGCCFGLKCMYHFVAKMMWHEDRRLWRLLSPPLSGVLSLFMVFLVASGLLQVFDLKFVEHPVRVMAFSFLVGYFSDKALAKMAEVADTLFGSAREEPREGKPAKPH
jgi:hypothetical protein